MIAQSFSSQIKMKNFLYTFLLSASLCITLSPQESHAISPMCRAISKPSSIKPGGSDEQLNGGSGCYFTPDSYMVKAYKMGLCSSVQPLTSSGFDPTVCETIYEDSSGYIADLVQNGTGATFPLADEDTRRPANGVYNYAYIVIDPVVQLKATLKLDDETWVTNSSNVGTTNEYTAVGLQYNIGTNSGTAELVDVNTGYLTPDAGTTKLCFLDNLDVDGVSITAAFLQSDQSSVASLVSSTSNLGDTAEACQASYIVGVQALSTPINVTDSTTDADMSFLITDNGAWAENYSDGSNQRMWFDIGPFSIVLETR